MAGTASLSAKKNGTDRQDRKKLRNAILAVVLILLFLTAAVLLFIGARRLLFTGNPRLKLREIRVTGTGYWKEHPERLMKVADLQPGVNLFLLDLRKIRQKITAISSVDSCSVYRVLPDTLVVKVTGRVPRAYLNHRNSPFVADGNAILIPRHQTMSTPGRLPVITGVRLTGLKTGEEIKQIRSAMELIMMTVHNFSDFKIEQISLKDPKKLIVYLSYCKLPMCRAVIPVKNNGMPLMLHVLQSAIIHAHKKNKKGNNFDLSYDGRVVIR